MKRYRLRPRIVEAFVWDGDADKANRSLGERYGTDWEYAPDGTGDLLFDFSSSGSQRAREGDYVFRIGGGHFHAVSAVEFEAIYEPEGPLWHRLLGPARTS